MPNKTISTVSNVEYTEFEFLVTYNGPADPKDVARRMREAADQIESQDLTKPEDVYFALFQPGVPPADGLIGEYRYLEV